MFLHFRVTMARRKMNTKVPAIHKFDGVFPPAKFDVPTSTLMNWPDNQIRNVV
ncbi:hypothetical protein Enr10x_37330 [Gimesia panareensis]|uniref:Uncharacterized protein n=1 Tax=Gimesia panareensis TaxID=2527978 RepID=A0A517Q9X1_9PLAN|nr:hypothetical protein Enr10x_37330 [Gimesia panareensis]